MTDEQRRIVERLARWGREGLAINGGRVTLRDCEAIAAALADLDRATLIWTREKPTEPGWYWTRGGGWSEVTPHGERAFVVRLVRRVDGSLSVYGPEISNWCVEDAEYAGPIPEPQEPQA